MESEILFALRAYLETRREEWGTSLEDQGMPHSLFFASHRLGGTRLDPRGMQPAEDIQRTEDPITPSQEDLRFHSAEA
jgi:hypothetical protein